MQEARHAYNAVIESIRAQPRHKSNPERLSQHRPNAERFHIQSPMLDLPLYMQRLAMDSVHEACYTCRSRRIQCDQTGMPCAKCEKAGLECFDKRPFRWVKGVAIRGKMQGRSYESKGTSSATNSDSTLAKPKRSVVKSSPGRVEKVKSDRGMSPMDFECDVHEYGPRILTRLIPDSNSPLEIPWTIEDPSVANLDQKSRYYIDYCMASRSQFRLFRPATD